LDVKTGFLVISDKDFDDYSCTRPTWPTPECVKQLKYYETHLKSIDARLAPNNNKSFQKIYDSLDGWQTLPKRPKR